MTNNGSKGPVTCRNCGNLIALGAEMNWNRKSGADSESWHLPTCPTDTPKQESDGMTETKKPASNGNFIEGLADAILPYIEDKIAGKVDEDGVARILEEKLKGAVFTTVTTVKVDKWDGTSVDMGLQHKCMPELLLACTARDKDGYRLNVWLVGPAATGKSTAPRKIAEAFKVPFFVHGAMTSAHELMGYVDGAGNYHTTGFRQAWEHGGVILYDEIDASLAQATLPFNGALANGYCTFPDSPFPIPRHKDCIVIAAANTWGLAATIDYCGRNKMDAAFLDRFVQVEWPIDESLEIATAPDKEWCAKVQAWRKAVKVKGIKGVMITPRATYYGCALIANGATHEQAARMTVKKAMSDSDWASIN